MVDMCFVGIKRRLAAPDAKREYPERVKYRNGDHAKGKNGRMRNDSRIRKAVILNKPYGKHRNYESQNKRPCITHKDPGRIEIIIKESQQTACKSKSNDGRVAVT